MSFIIAVIFIVSLYNVSYDVVCVCSGWQFGTMNAIRSLLMYAESPVGPKTSSPAAIGVAIQKSLQQIAGCFAKGKGGGATRWPSFLEGIIEFMDAYPGE